MKKFLPFWGVLLIAALALLPAPARGEVYVEAYLGGVFGASSATDITLQKAHVTGFITTLGSLASHIPCRLDPAFQGGIKLGTWFVKEGFLGYDYPSWMKYFGFYLDFSYHRLNFPPQNGTTSISWVRVAPNGFVIAGPATAQTTNQFASDGRLATLAFMFVARYGFYPDATCPFGRLQPYLAVGPALFITSQNPRLTIPTYLASGNGLTLAFSQQTFGGSDSQVDLGLAAEAGLRWMALKNVSLEASFKYRYARPSFAVEYSDTIFNDTPRRSFSFHPSYNLFSFQVGAAYHF